MACDLCGSHTCAEPRGTLFRFLTAAAAGIKGPWDAVVSVHRPRSHLPQVRSFSLKTLISVLTAAILKCLLCSDGCWDHSTSLGLTPLSLPSGCGHVVCVAISGAAQQ